MSRGPMIVVSVRLEAELVERMQRVADMPGVEMSLSELIRRCCRAQFNGEPLTYENVVKHTTDGDKRSARGEQ